MSDAPASGEDEPPADTGGTRDPERPHDAEGAHGGGYSTLAVAVSVLAGLLATAAAYLLVRTQGTFFENLYRVQPTVEDGGVGADWVAGNTDPVLDFLIALVHAADVIMGVFILVMVFIHWAAFRRLGSRMRQPGEPERRTAATDGGREGDDG